MRRTPCVVLVGAAATLVAACATGPRWHLVHPPEAPDAAAPGGGRLFPRAPVAEWRVVAAYETEDACDAARGDALEANLTRAHAEAGDDAKYDLGVRRAVNARCVPVPQR